MRRTLLLTSDFPPRRGGVATYYASLCQRLPPEAIGVLTEARPDATTFDQGARYPIERAQLLSPWPWVWPKWWPAIRRTAQVVRRQHYQLLLVGQILPFGTVAWWLRRRTGIPYVVMVHGMDVALPRGRKYWLCRLIMRHAEAVVASSRTTEQLLSRYQLPQLKTTVITPGVEPPCAPAAHLTMQLRERYRLREDPVLLTVGRLVPRKGHREVITLLLELRRSIKDVRYVIVGDGPELPQLRRFAQANGVAGAVVFTGAQSAEELNAWYELCDVFVMPVQPTIAGDVEGFGIVYLEAANFAKPVVATDVGGVREAVADGVSGMLVPPGDRRRLLEVISRLLREPAYAHRLGIQGQARVLREFSWDDRAVRWRRVLSTQHG